MQPHSGSMTTPSSHLQDAVGLMMRFAERTGLITEVPPQRYLWTDAFAVCNFLEIARLTGKTLYADLALRLVDCVHHTLGKHRAGDARIGWLSGASEQDGEAHPTRGGLRIGKSLPERPLNEPYDADLEWERDGQYFHYLTKWAHALDQVARATRQPRFNVWARELMQTAYTAFTKPSAHAPLSWKMSIDLSRPLVPSMGQHDPLDGLVTCDQLRATAADLQRSLDDPTLDAEMAGFAAMLQQPANWITSDPLGLGGVLMDATRLAQRAGRLQEWRDELLHTLLAVALAGLRQFAPEDIRRPASHRLAFRELGLSIGLHGMSLINEKEHATHERRANSNAVRTVLQALEPYALLGDAIEKFWLDPVHRSAATWVAHRDINDVMLAASLVPAGCLVIA